MVGELANADALVKIPHDVTRWASRRLNEPQVVVIKE
jgi:hypothetical protein